MVHTLLAAKWVNTSLVAGSTIIDAIQALCLSECAFFILRQTSLFRSRKCYLLENRKKIF